MNQSDIRGLVCRQQARADIDILRREHFAFLKSASSVRHRRAYHIVFTHIAPIVPAPFSILPLFNFQTKKSGFGGWVMKKTPIHQAAFLLLLASYSLNNDHINPANSLAIATAATHGDFP